MRTSPSGKPVVALTMGDKMGVGPEIIIRILLEPAVTRLASFLIIGDRGTMERAALLVKPRLTLKTVTMEELERSGGVLKGAAGVLDPGSSGGPRDPLRYIDCAVDLIKKKLACAVVTAPVNKESISSGGDRFVGHTEYIAGLTGTKSFAMMFVAGPFRVTVLTRHIPLRAVSQAIDQPKIREAIGLTDAFLRERLSIRSPRIGVAALNPHAGEGGMIGNEEIDVIRPAIEAERAAVPGLTGPIPADSAYALFAKKKIDCLIAMYHDQAMIPLKTFAQGECVNVTLGLPFVRTSPAHGTAYDIAWKGKADPSSMIAATTLACRLSGGGRC